MIYNAEKFKNLVHYICSKCDDPSVLGGTKLNKILWFSDVISYLTHETPLTGESYRKLQYGPVPSTILATLEKLKAEGKLIVRQVNFGGYPKKEFISLSDPDINCFSSEEISLVDSVIESICKNHTAKSISDMTHDEIWKMAKIGEIIPYEAIFVNVLGEIDEHDIEWADNELQAGNCVLDLDLIHSKKDLRCVISAFA